MNDITSSIAYNRSTRKWEYTQADGTKQSFPSGQKGKYEAQRALLQDQLPAAIILLDHLYAHGFKQPEQVAQLPNIKQRAHEGALLIVSNALLTPAPHDPPTILARAATPSRTLEYLIQQPANQHLYTCSCPDWHQGLQILQLPPLHPERPIRGAPYIQNIGIMCKHTWGYHLSTVLDKPLHNQNPYATKHATNLLGILKNNALHNPALPQLLEDSAPAAMTRGTLTIALPDQAAKTLKSQPSLLKTLNRIIAESTNNTQHLQLI